MKLDDITQSETGQAQKGRHCVLSRRRGLQPSRTHRRRVTVGCWRLGGAGGGAGRGRGVAGGVAGAGPGDVREIVSMTQALSCDCGERSTVYLRGARREYLPCSHQKEKKENGNYVSCG